MTDEEAYMGLTQAEKDALDLMGQGRFPEMPNDDEQAILESLVEKGYVDAIQADERNQGGWFELTVCDDILEDFEICRHVMPNGDLRPHVANGEGDCWCEPHDEPETMTWWHNAADGREDYETGRRKRH